MLIICYLLILCLFIQFIFFAVVSRAFANYKAPDGNSQLPVSIVVCARNEAENLKRLIPLLLKQNHNTFEVILVDDRSEDETSGICGAFSNERFRYIRIEAVPENFNSKKYALTRGIEAAEHELILLTDADCVPASFNWVTNMSSGFGEDNEFVLGFSMYKSEPGLLNMLIRFETVWTAIHYLGLALAGMPYMGVGRNMAYRKAVFKRNSGFEGIAHLTGGDDDLLINRYGNAKNCAVIIGKEATTWSVPKKTWRSFFIQKRRHLSAGRHYSPASQLVLGVLSLSHIFGYIFIGILLFNPVYGLYAVAGLAIRTVLLLYTFKRACQKLEIPFSTGKILPMDLLYAIYYPIMGISASVRKTVRWS
jgi:glycosyltransferase involved in cell wall biosynthesis